MLGARKVTFGAPLPKVYIDCPVLVWLAESLGTLWPQSTSQNPGTWHLAAVLREKSILGWMWVTCVHQNLSCGNLEAHHQKVCFAFRKPHFSSNVYMNTRMWSQPSRKHYFWMEKNFFHWFSESSELCAEPFPCCQSRQWVLSSYVAPRTPCPCQLGTVGHPLLPDNSCSVCLLGCFCLYFST